MFSNLLEFMDLTGPLTIDVPSLLSIPVKASHVMLEILLLFKFRILPLTEAAEVEKNIVAPVAFVYPVIIELEFTFITAEVANAAVFEIKVKVPVVLHEIFVKVFPLISRVRVGAKLLMKLITPEAATVCVVVLKSLLVIETDDEGVVEV